MVFLKKEADLSASAVKKVSGFQISKDANFYKGIGLTVVLAIIATLLAPLPGLAVMGSLTVAMLIGIFWRATLGLPTAYTKGIQFSARSLLRAAIILTGVRLNFGLVAANGLQVLLLDLLLIIFGISFIPWLAHKLGLKPSLGFLMAVGQSICGASAVGAAASLRKDATDEDVSLAVALCGIVGTLGVLFFAFANSVLGWQGHFYALISGSTLHEIAQVVAAGPIGGPGSADFSLIVKLTRVMLLAPVMLILAFIFAARAGKQNAATGSKQIPIPWFVLGFLIVGGLNSLGLFPKDLASLILQIATFLFAMAMSGMGLMVNLAVVRKTGLRALGVATLSFAIFIGVSLLLTSLLGLG